MSKTKSTRRWWLGGVGVVALVAASVSVSSFSRPGQKSMPAYQGKTAEQWLRQGYATNQAALLLAFREMGSTATPVLLQAFEKEDSPWDRCYQWVYPNLPALVQQQFTPPIPAGEIWNAASVVLFYQPLLGEEREKLLALLLRLLENKNSRAPAYLMSPVVGIASPESTNCLPVLTRCLEAKDLDVRREAAVGLAKMETSAKAAIPALTIALKDPDLEVRLNAASALWAIDRRTNSVVPILEEALKVMPADDLFCETTRLLGRVSPNSPALLPALIKVLGRPNPDNSDDSYRSAALWRLGKYGPSANAAVPLLVQITHQQSILRGLALDALKEVDPEVYESEAKLWSK